MATMTAAAQPAPNGYYTDAKGPNAPYHEKQAYTDPAPMNSHPQQGMGTMAGASSQGRTSTDSYDGEDAHLPTVLFAIPFPAATKSSSAKKPISPFLLYALPRAPYHKPLEDADGNKLEKEGFVKKAERKWQEEIAEGERIRKGEEPDAGNWKKFKGKATGVSYLPSFHSIEIPLKQFHGYFRPQTKLFTGFLILGSKHLVAFLLSASWARYSSEPSSLCTLKFTHKFICVSDIRFVP